jgi:hypothetical protein
MSEPDDLTPEEEQVRRLLADARHTQPVPDDVAARLDAVLADLRDEDPEAPAPVVASQRPVDLAAARRRRNARSWLVAAVAVVAVGFGINQVAHMDVSGSDDDGGSSSDSAASGETVQRPGDRDAGAGRRGQDDSPSSASAHAPEVEAQPEAPATPVRLDPDRFGTQVTALRDRAELARNDLSTNSAAADGALMYGLDRLTHAYKSTCPTPDSGRGHALPVRYGGQPGVLVFRPVRGDTQVVDLFLCGSDHPERSITLPAS